MFVDPRVRNSQVLTTLCGAIRGCLNLPTPRVARQRWTQDLATGDCTGLTTLAQFQASFMLATLTIA